MLFRGQGRRSRPDAQPSLPADALVAASRRLGRGLRATLGLARPHQYVQAVGLVVDPHANRSSYP